MPASPPLFIGLAESGVLALAAVVALLSAFLVLRADLGRRRLPVRPTDLLTLAMLAGLLGAKISPCWRFGPGGINTRTV